MIFTYRSRGGDQNVGQIFKTGTEKPAYTIDFADGLGSATISSASTGAVNASNSFVTSLCVSTTTVSGSQVLQQVLTCGTSGTSAAPDGSRFKITTTATLSNNEILVFDTYVFVQAATYGPS